MACLFLFSGKDPGPFPLYALKVINCALEIVCMKKVGRISSYVQVLSILSFHFIFLCLKNKNICTFVAVNTMWHTHRWWFKNIFLSTIYTFSRSKSPLESPLISFSTKKISLDDIKHHCAPSFQSCKVLPSCLRNVKVEQLIQSFGILDFQSIFVFLLFHSFYHENVNPRDCNQVIWIASMPSYNHACI